MRLFRLTFATILQRKAWAICAFAILVLPFVLPTISSATEKPALEQPARILAAWNTLWISALIWGLFTAAREGENNAKSGIGEYFLTTGVSTSRQLFEIWLAVFSFIVPMTVATALISQFAAIPGDPAEQSMWWVMNLQYATLFLLVTGPLLALSTALASRFGGITGFSATLCVTIYGLYGVGYLDNMVKIEENAIIKGFLLFSPQYRFAGDFTQRLCLKSGPIPSAWFWTMVLYFIGITTVYAGISRICFRSKVTA